MKPFRFFSTIAAFAAGTAAVATTGMPADAAMLRKINVYPATVSAGTCYDDECFNNGGSGINASTKSSYSAARNTAVLSKTPSLSAYAEANLGIGNLGGTYFSTGASSEVGLTYQVMLAGPQNTTVPVNLAASGLIKVTGDFDSTGYSYTAYGRLQVLGPTDYVVNEEASNYGTTVQGKTRTASFDIDRVFQMVTNTPYDIDMRVIASASLRIDSGLLTIYDDLTSYTTIDPTFTVDPAYTKDYTLVFSEGLGGTVSPVPLPAAAPLFGAALLALGVVGRWLRRRRGPAGRPCTA